MKKIVCLVIIIVFYSCVGNEKKFFDSNIDINQIEDNLKKYDAKIKRNTKEIEEIEIEDCEKIINMKDFENLKSLKKLRLSNTIIENYNVIYELKNLEVLEISSSIILDEVGNKDGDLKKLRVFNISQSTDFKNLNLIKNSYNLEILNFSGVKKIEDIKFLEKFKKLKEIFMSDNLIKDISYLKNSKNLEKLVFVNNLVTNIDVLEKFKNLKYLGVGENKITDFKSIKNLERLEHLIFDKVKTKEEIKEILPKNLYDNGKIDNEEYNEGNITRIYTKMILWRSEYVKI